MDITNPKEALAQARYVASLVRIGATSYDEAKRICEPLLTLVNSEGKKIANRYNRRYTPITFTGLAR